MLQPPPASSSSKVQQRAGPPPRASTAITDSAMSFGKHCPMCINKACLLTCRWLYPPRFSSDDSAADGRSSKTALRPLELDDMLLMALQQPEFADSWLPPLLKAGLEPNLLLRYNMCVSLLLAARFTFRYPSPSICNVRQPQKVFFFPLDHLFSNIAYRSVFLQSAQGVALLQHSGIFFFF